MEILTRFKIRQLSDGRYFAKMLIGNDYTRYLVGDKGQKVKSITVFKGGVQ
jgi:hypothetical protein